MLWIHPFGYGIKIWVGFQIWGWFQFWKGFIVLKRVQNRVRIRHCNNAGPFPPPSLATALQTTVPRGNSLQPARFYSFFCFWKGFNVRQKWLKSVFNVRQGVNVRQKWWFNVRQKWMYRKLNLDVSKLCFPFFAFFSHFTSIYIPKKIKISFFRHS